MIEIEKLEKAIVAWREYTRATPDFAPWLESDLRFAIELARRIEIHGAANVDEEDRERILELAGPAGNPGPIGGFAVHEIADARVGNVLCDAQEAVRKIVRHLG